MKQNLLKTIAIGLLAMVGVSAWAQSTYTYTASNWSAADKGSISVSESTISVSGVNANNLVDIQNTTSFKIPYRQTYVIITGTNFYVPASIETDPCVYLENDKTNRKASAKVIPTATKIIVDISDKLPTATDFFGNVTISQMNIIIKGSTSTTITNIELYQPDLIDECSSSQIKVRRQGNSWESESDNFTRSLTSGNKYELSFTPLADGKEFRFYLNPTSFKLNNSNTYIVIEADANINDGTRKLEFFTLGGENKASSSSNMSGFNVTLTNTHKLFILNPARSFDNARSAYLGGETLACTKLGFIMKSSGTSALKIYRIGFYNIREIQDLYTDLKNYKFSFTNAFESSVGSEQNGAQRTVAINATGLSSDEMYLQLKSLGNFNIVNGGNKPEIDLRNATITSSNPTLLDIPSQFTTDGTFFLLSSANYAYFPTVVNKAKIKDATYANYYDGNNTPYSNKMGSTSTYYYAHNRKLVEGYSSCCLPFATNATILPNGLTAYTFTSCTTEGAVTFTKAEGAIAANTPLIIKAAAAGYYLIPASATGDAAIAAPSSYYPTDPSNDVKFVGSFVNEVPTGDYATTQNYGINSTGDKFLKMKNDTKTTFYRAFLASSSTTFAPTLLFDDGNGTTDIVSMKDVHGLEIISDGAIYNLQGVRMNGNKLPKGIYVKNGRKFVVK